MSSHLILRAETKYGERRTPLIPPNAAVLIRRGVRIDVESSSDRAFLDSEYRAIGANLVPAGTWRTADPATLVLGLKELPSDTSPLPQIHSYFAHCFRGQRDARRVLEQFRNGGGTLYDMEYLVDSEGRRIAAFGYWAGFVGAAVGLLAYAERKNYGRALNRELTPYPDAATLVQTVRKALDGADVIAGITGHLGRAGRGARALLDQIAVVWKGWDQAECAGSGAIRGLLDVDVLVHCVGIRSERRPLLEASDLDRERRLSVLADVTCDQESPLHLFPFYRRGTTLDHPTVPIVARPSLDLVAIDHLPTLLPRESSTEFSSSLLPYLVEYFSQGPSASNGGYSVWQKSRATFVHALASMEVR